MDVFSLKYCVIAFASLWWRFVSAYAQYTVAKDDCVQSTWNRDF